MPSVRDRTPSSGDVSPPVVLTLLAPADRCNQRCPECIIDLVGEPVRQFVLSPGDYGDIVDVLVSAGVPVHSISFQGYEVTLPTSWPYVEAAFAAANRHGIDKGFITNGMLLHRWIDRVRELDPSRIAISIDGSDEETHDSLRGLAGALMATNESVLRFLEHAPEFRDRLAVASTLFLRKNKESLLGMPAVLHRLGLSRWALSAGLKVQDGKKQPIDEIEELADAFAALIEVGEREGLQVHVNDEFGRLRGRGRKRPSGFRSLRRPNSIVRVEPAGYVRVGPELLEAFDPKTARSYDPARDSFLDVIGYRERSEHGRGRRSRGDL